MQSDFNKAFKAPRYTGVTLSLLSLFVLACMFVVWEKIPEQTQSTRTNSFSVWAEDSLAPPLLAAAEGYYQELNSSADIKFLTRSQIYASFMEDKTDCPNLIVVTENNDSGLTNLLKKCKEKIPLAFHATRGQSNSSLNGKLISGFIPTIAKRTADGILFARFLSAPSRGQFYFAQHNFIGVDGDRWSPLPEISFLCDSRFEDLENIFLKNAKRRETSRFHIDYKVQPSIETALEILTKSDAKEYIPDLVLTGNLLKLASTEIKLEASVPNNFYFYLYAKGPHYQLCKRIISNITENVDFVR